MTRKGWFALALLALSAPMLAEDAAKADVEAEAQADVEAAEEARKKVYRSIGKDGSVTFSDQGEAGQQEVEVRSPNTVDITVPKLPRSAPQEQNKQDGDDGYRITITRPSPEQTFQNPSEPLAVGYAIEPALQGGDKAEVIYDGQVLEGATIEWPNRGEHTVQVRIVDKSGAELASSDTVTFFVHRPSRRLP